MKAFRAIFSLVSALVLATGCACDVGPLFPAAEQLPFDGDDGDDGDDVEGEGEGEGESAAEGEGESAAEGEGEGECLPDAGNGFVDDLAPDTIVRRSIRCIGAIDLFRIEGVVPGHIYRVDAVVDNVREGSTFEPRVTVFDDGREGLPPGGDYVRSGLRAIAFAALGGNVNIAIEDDSGGSGGDYVILLADLTEEVHRGPLAARVTEDAFDVPSGVVVYDVDARAGDHLVVDLIASGETDNRLFVVSPAGDWIARNDDRSADDRNPLIDMVLPGAGSFRLLVENEREGALDIGFTLQVTLR